jgi:hypothetical protein
MAEEKEVITQDASPEPAPVVEPEKDGVSLEDYEAVVVALTKAERDRDNYRKGLLKAKGKLPDEDTEGEEDKMRLIVAEELAKTQIFQLQAKQEEIVKNTLKENKELKVALKNRTQIANNAGGSSQAEPDVKVESLPKDVLEYAKKHNLDLATLAANMKNYRQGAVTNINK